MGMSKKHMERARELNKQGKKHCKGCDTVKSLDDFSKHSKAWDSKRSKCRSCESARRARYYEVNREKAIEQVAKYRATPAGKAVRAKANAKYRNSPEGKAVQAKASAKHYGANREQVLERQAKYRVENVPPSPEWETKKQLPHRMYLIRFTQGNRTYIKGGLTWRATKARFANDIYHSRMSNFEILDEITFRDHETCKVAERTILAATLDSHVTPVIAFGGSVNECRRPEATEQILSMFDSARAGMDNN